MIYVKCDQFLRSNDIRNRESFVRHLFLQIESSGLYIYIQRKYSHIHKIIENSLFAAERKDPFINSKK